MGAPLAIRTDLEAAELRRLARREGGKRVAARLSALANVLDGMSREAAARAAGMDRQTLRDWVIRFNAEGMESLRDQPRSGRRPWTGEGQQAVLKAIALRGPNPERDGVLAWRIVDLCRIAAERFGLTYREGGMRRLAKSLDLSWQKTQPRHPKADGAAEERVKGGARLCAEEGGPAPSRGRGPTLVPGRGPRRPEGPRHLGLARTWPPRLEGVIDHRYASAWLYAAVRTGTNQAFALVIPEVSAAAMQAFLDRFAATLPEKVHAALLLDGAEWHTADNITVPDKITAVSCRSRNRRQQVIPEPHHI